MSPLLAQSGHPPLHRTCPLSGVKQTWPFALPAAGGWPVNGAPPFSLPDAGDSTAVRLSAPGAVRHDVAHQVVHVVLQISDDVLDDVSDRDHAHDLARVQHW